MNACCTRLLRALLLAQVTVKPTNDSNPRKPHQGREERKTSCQSSQSLHVQGPGLLAIQPVPWGDGSSLPHTDRMSSRGAGHRSSAHAITAKLRESCTIGPSRILVTASVTLYSIGRGNLPWATTPMSPLSDSTPAPTPPGH